MLNVGGTITNGESDGHLNGPPGHWIEEIAGPVLRRGFDTFVYWPEEDPVGQIRRFSDLFGEVRERVDRQRR